MPPVARACCITQQSFGLFNLHSTGQQPASSWPHLNALQGIDAPISSGSFVDGCATCRYHCRPARASKLSNPSTSGSAASPPPGGEAMAAWMAGAAAAPFSVPLLRAAQFLRQAGLVPKVLLQYITELHDVSAAA